MKNFRLNLKATLDPEQTEKDYRALFVAGSISDNSLDRRIAELSRMFKVYANGCPAPFWTPGLAVTDELCRVTETYLDYATIRQTLLCLAGKSLKVQCPESPLISRAEGWIRFLHALPVFNGSPDPASLVRLLAGNEADRVRFLFSVYLPDRFGGSFGRYPVQMSFIQNWIRERYTDCRLLIPCLDAACGSGEGSYELAGALLECGIDAARISVTGVTICPLEVFASAHASFPHDPLREERYRNYVGSVAGRGRLPEMKFVADDLRYRESPEQYRMIICNGILGGPLLHERIQVEGVLRKLAVSLHSGGVLLAADRFHGGWKKILSRADLEAMLVNCGLVVLTVGEGVAGMKI